MAAFYPDHIIDNVRQASDIVDVLSEFLRLKKRGRNFVCKCPFHHEKTPSFNVSPERQIFHCFGCGKGGNVFTFLMEHEQMSFPEAVKYLAKRANITLPEKKHSDGDKEKFERLYFAHELATAMYREALVNSDNGKKVLDYLHTKRGLKDETIEQFQIGFAPDGWENLIGHARSKGLSAENLYKAGLVIRRDSGEGFYDRFRQRLIFPIFDFSHRVIAFGARALSSADNVKYLNSPETPLYNKSRVLYGLSHSRTEIRSSREALIVEGYMDYLALYQEGIRNAVAVSGTSFTRNHALLLKRYADTVTLLFDADPAGQSAAERCAEHFFAVGIEVRVAVLPSGDDPDSFVRSRGTEEMKKVIENSISYFEFVKQTAHPPFEKRNEAGAQLLIRSQLNLVSKASDELSRERMLQKLSDLYNISYGTLEAELKPEKSRDHRPPEARYSVNPDRQNLERNVLQLVIAHPSLFESDSEPLKAEWFDTRQYRAIFELAVNLRDDGQLSDFAGLVDRIDDDELRRTLTSLMSDESEPGDWETAFREYKSKLRDAYRVNRLRTLGVKLAEAEKANDSDEVERLKQEINKIQ